MIMLNTLKIYKNYASELFVLALPMIMGNLGIILIGAGSVFVAARYSTDSLAAISIANSITNCIFIFGIGVMSSISPLLSNLRGQKSGAKKYFMPTVLFAMILAALVAIMMLMSIPFVQILGFEAKLVPTIKEFIFITAFSTFGAYLHVCLKEFLQAFEIVFFPNFIAIISVFLNIFLSFVFVFGWFNSPSMGAIGIAYACLLMRTLEGLIVLLYCLHFFNMKKYFEINYFKNLIKIGLPIAMAILFEFLAFNIGTILMGRVSGLYAASQNILLTMTSATFMVTVALSTAIAVKVGFANGSDNVVDLKRYSFAGTVITVGFMTLCSLAFVFFPKFFINIFTHDPALVKICVPIMFLLGIFQIFDGLQVSLGGIFKGLKKTNVVMLIDLLAYWAIGLPLGFILAFKYHLDLYGFWVGLSIAIVILAMTLFVILIRHFNKLKL